MAVLTLVGLEDKASDDLKQLARAEADETPPAAAPAAALVLPALAADGMCCEGTWDGRAAAPNGCGWVRPKATAKDEEKEVYKVKGFSADTACVRRGVRLKHG